MQFIVTSNIRKHCNQKGRRVSRDFLVALDAHVQDKLDQACGTHNGGKKTLDLFLAEFVIEGSMSDDWKKGFLVGILIGVGGVIIGFLLVGPLLFN